MLKKQDSTLVVDIHFKGTDGDGVAVAYVYYDFSARNAQSTSTIGISVEAGSWSIVRDLGWGVEGD